MNIFFLFYFLMVVYAMFNHKYYKNVQKLKESPGNWGIHNSGYWKIVGCAHYFLGNSWKLGASIIRVIGK